MSNSLNSIKYRPGENVDLTFARSKPTYINAAPLTAGLEFVVAVPQGANVCIFSADSDIYVRPDATAEIPAGVISDGSASELNPAQWDVHDVAELHIISPDDAAVTLSFYR
jgi:hypothetical protein